MARIPILRLIGSAAKIVACIILAVVAFYPPVAGYYIAACAHDGGADWAVLGLMAMPLVQPLLLAMPIALLAILIHAAFRETFKPFLWAVAICVATSLAAGVAIYAIAEAADAYERCTFGF